LFLNFHMSAFGMHALQFERPLLETESLSLYFKNVWLEWHLLPSKKQNVG